MSENVVISPACDECGQPITAIEENCGHIEAELPRILDGGQRDLLRRVYYLERVVSELLQRAAVPPKRRGRPPKAETTAEDAAA